MAKSAQAVGTAVAAGPGSEADENTFVHLHLHTEYSLLDGGNRIDRLVARVKELGMTAVGVTDHGNLFGAMAFYTAAKEAGIKPILGVEAYVAHGDRRDRTYTGVVDGGYHLVLLAENGLGWRNLLKLCSEAYLTGFYYRPRIDRALLEAHSGGLIAISGHLGSELAYPLVEYEKTGDEAHFRRAVEAARWHARTFSDRTSERERDQSGAMPTLLDPPAPQERCAPAQPRFYVELQRHIPEQNAINRHLIRLAQELRLPLVATNDAHFLRAEDHDAHDTLICISMGKTKDDQDRLRYPPQLYVKSPGEMLEEFRGSDEGGRWREALANTARIAERCNVEMSFVSHAPLVRVVRPRERRAYAGEADLTGWFKAFCADYRLEPFDAEGPGAPAPPGVREELKTECDRALRELCEAGLIWRYGPEQPRRSERCGADEPGPQEAADGSGERRREIRERLDRELRILADKGISAYFLIVWDFVNWARQRAIPALARGSGVGTMVGYTLGLSNACPVRYGLLFERFTDPDRAEYPDIDVDLCQDGRGDVLNYVREKYGHVAQIITFGTLKARAAVRDVGRVLGVPLPEVDRLAKLIPEQLGVTLDRALEQEPQLRALYDTDATVRRLIDNARAMEGQTRHASVHAAGVVMATRPLHEIVPLYKQPGSDDVVTQWDGPTCEKVGLLKMDFLGLRTLSTIERAKSLIRQTLSEQEIRRAIASHAPSGGSPGCAGGAGGAGGADPLDLDRLSFDDQRVFDLFRRADTTGVFQFESGGMRRLLAEMKPDRLEDLIAANALFRPGPMDLIPAYNKRKHALEPVPKVHPIVERFTAETYGVMVYQEQVMQIVHGLGGVPLRSAYALIKAISKKKNKEIEKNRELFVAGAQLRGLTRPRADELFEMILKFAGYGFNKSHSTGYAIVAYQTAWLKAYFPNQYMAAFLTYESKSQKVEDWIKYKDDCRRTLFVNGKVGVDVRPPDVNSSDVDFTVVFGADEPRDALHGHVRFGLGAIKGAGEKAAAAIVAERRKGGPYRSLHDFCQRVPPGASGGVNKATIEALVTCGAFDGVHARDKRAAVVATIDAAVSAGQEAARDRAAGQAALFGGEGLQPSTHQGRGPAEPALARVRPWTESETLQKEKEVLGFYASSHPLERHRDDIERFANARTTSIAGHPQDARVIIGGLIKSVRPIVTRNGKSAGSRMAIVTFEDAAGVIDAVLFAETYAEHGPALINDAVVFLIGKVDHSRGDPQLIVDRVVPIESAAAFLATRVEHQVEDDAGGTPGAAAVGAGDGRGRGALDQIAGLVRSQRAGERGAEKVPLTIVVRSGGRRFVLETPSPAITPAAEVLDHLREVLGTENVRIIGGRPVEAAKKNGNGRGAGHAVARRESAAV